MADRFRVSAGFLPDEAPSPDLLSRCPTFDDAANLAKRKLPGFLFDYLSGGCDAESCLRRNVQSFRDTILKPRYGLNIKACDTATDLLGNKWSAPIGVAPVGFAGGLWPGAETALAEAAANHTLPFILSTVSVSSIEEIGAAGNGAFWFQLYVTDDPGINTDLLNRARKAGSDTLVLTVDVPVYSKRNRDLRHGLSMPFRARPEHYLNMAMHPDWTLRTLAAGRPGYANLTAYAKSGESGDVAASRILAARPSVTWEMIAQFRREWEGKLIVKGILSPEDAKLALKAGADMIIVSNHGGRQFDAAPAPLEALPPVLKAINGKIPVGLDSGIRGGADVLSALASGADFCFAGRPFYWTVCGLGTQGAEHAMRLFRSEIRTNLSQAGIVSMKDRKSLSALLAS